MNKDISSEATSLLKTQLPSPSSRHSHKLCDGRTLSYFVFADDDDEAKSTNPDAPAYPILYLHGFPGAAIEARICAAAVARRGCRIYAPDRPGFGHSDPLPSCYTTVGEQKHGGRSRQTKGRGGTKAEKWLRGVVGDLWSFVRERGWKRFSIIAFSGGAVFALAMIKSYLDDCRRARQQACPTTCAGGRTLPKIDAVSFVAGVCCSAGTDGMMSSIKEFHYLTCDSCSSTSCSRFLSRARLSLYHAAFRAYLYTLPVALQCRVLRAFCKKQFPVVDQEVIDRDMALHMVTVLRSAYRQGPRGCMMEAAIEFGTHEIFEREQWREYNDSGSNKQRLRDGSTCTTGGDCSLPQVSIFHGLEDAHAPLSHGHYIHELLKDASILVQYDSLAHMSLFVEKVEDYVGFVARHSTACKV